MIGHDQLTKDLFETFFGDLLRLTVPDIAEHLDLKNIRFLKDELFTDLPEGEQRHLDLVAEVYAIDGEPEVVLAHVEPEGQARSTMGERLWRYAMQLRLRHNNPVVSIVIYRTGGEGGVHKITVREKAWGEELATFSYFAFGLSSADAETYVTRPEPLAWALAAQMRSRSWTRAQHKLRCLQPIAGAPVDDARRSLLANFVETYIQLGDRDAAEYEQLLADVANQEVAEMEMTWADEIEAKGIEQGMQQGMCEGMQRMLLLQLEQRFGNLTESLRRRIGGIDSADRLSQLAKKLLVAESLEDMGLE